MLASVHPILKLGLCPSVSFERARSFSERKMTNPAGIDLATGEGVFVSTHGGDLSWISKSLVAVRAKGPLKVRLPVESQTFRVDFDAKLVCWS
jgi:hypothetical protein